MNNCILNIVVKGNKQLVYVSAIEVYSVLLLLLGTLRSKEKRATRTSIKVQFALFTRTVTLSNVGEPYRSLVPKDHTQVQKEK